MNCNENTEILYRGMDIEGIAENPEVAPIYHTTAYCVKDTEDYNFANNGGKYFYNRTANPNRDCLGESISYLEHGEKTIVCSSGMAAISTTLLGLLKKGDHAVISKAIYGETIELIEIMLEKYGIEVTFADFTDTDEIEKDIKSNTVLLYTEIIANPLTLIVDIEKVAEIAHKHNVLVVVDSTFTTPFVIKPIDKGADIVIHSLTKYFGGHSDITGGSITTTKEMVKKLMPSYLLLGCCMDPNTAWLTSRSIKTMGMRVKTQNKNAEILANALSKNPKVKVVYHPSIVTHPQHELAKSIFTNGFGAMMSFRVEDDLNKVNEFMHRLKVVKYMGTLGGIRTTIAHPATAFRNEFTAEQLIEMGMHEGLIRISTGAEEVDDLIQDFNNALEVF
ncbi:MAG: aminotransferase class I/II-fold pyridoxal phosphate-dependent enzyme [Candidatus Metalachnospira sp.]|nr:aminotransferase class I/II-fold pyridoxal phosphate-dependent enzyme [Candidatus Metalachnospira sp.]